MIKDYKLERKEKLTNDVYKLVFSCKEKMFSEAGQFITFILPSSKKRAYSIALDNQDGSFDFIIKKLENGKGGSKEICDLKVGDEIKGIIPVGNFVLKQNHKNKMFIGTGTGFAPLYYQIKKLEELKSNSKIKFIFGVRKEEDLFYIKELNELERKIDLENVFYLSRDDNKKYKNGYVTDYLNLNNIENFEEFYICGSPDMVNSAKGKLNVLGISDEDIFFEKY